MGFIGEGGTVQFEVDGAMGGVSVMEGMGRVRFDPSFTSDGGENAVFLKFLFVCSYTRVVLTVRNDFNL